MTRTARARAVPISDSRQPVLRTSQSIEKWLDRALQELRQFAKRHGT